jgi:glutamate racemase
MKRNERPIGVFDSGLGGLTVLAAMRRALPRENFIYFGDTARVPYGTKSPEAVIRFSSEITAWLVAKGIKTLVVACNTASSVALDAVRAAAAGVPVTGVIEPGAAAFAASGCRKVIVIGTAATVASRAYGRALRRAAPGALVTEQACPLFVPLVEEGWSDPSRGRRAAALTRLAAEEYLSPYRGKGYDSLILGCTHYPLLRRIIARVMGRKINIIDSAEAAACSVRETLTREGLLRRAGRGSASFFVSDAPARFSALAAALLGIKPGKVGVKRF